MVDVDLRRGLRAVAGVFATPRTMPVREDPVRRQVDRALEYIRDHYGEERERRRRQYARGVRRVGVSEARQQMIEERRRTGEGINVGDVTTFGDMVEWHVMEARAAGEGRYVLVVER